MHPISRHFTIGRAGPNSGARHFHRSLPGTPEAVRDARRWVVGVLVRGLGADEENADTAALLTSEAATNAIAHTRSGDTGGRFSIAVRPFGRNVRIEVYDAGGAPTSPRLSTPGPCDEHGRGLALISALAEDWGIITGSRAHGVFFALRTRSD